MLNKDYVSTEVNNIFSMLDAGELPETHSYLASIMDSDGFVSEEPFAIATNLVNCDKPQKLPDYLIEFITELYESKIYLETADLCVWTILIVLISVLLEKLMLRLLDAARRALEDG